jgi:hypothetical protein
MAHGFAPLSLAADGTIYSHDLQEISFSTHGRSRLNQFLWCLIQKASPMRRERVFLQMVRLNRTICGK